MGIEPMMESLQFSPASCVRSRRLLNLCHIELYLAEDLRTLGTVALA
jgi:hypothetical protein